MDTNHTLAAVLAIIAGILAMMGSQATSPFTGQRYESARLRFLCGLVMFVAGLGMILLIVTGHGPE